MMTREEVLLDIVERCGIDIDGNENVMVYDQNKMAKFKKWLFEELENAEQEPCEDAVSRQAVKETLRNRIGESISDCINALPSVTPAISEIDKFNDSVNRATVLALINDVKYADGFKDYSQYEYLFDQVDKMPLTTPTRKKGKWIYDKTIQNWRCSECNETPKTLGFVGTDDFMVEHFRFCNHCGAEMEVEEDEKNG